MPGRYVLKMSEKIKFKSLLFGVVLFFCLYLVFHYLENTIFLTKIMEYREISGIENSFIVAKFYDLVRNPTILFYRFLFITFLYGITAYFITLDLKNYIILHTLILALGTQILLKLSLFLLDPKNIINYYGLTIAEFLWAVFICLLVGTLRIIILHKKYSLSKAN